MLQAGRESVQSEAAGHRADEGSNHRVKVPSESEPVLLISVAPSPNQSRRDRNTVFRGFG